MFIEERIVKLVDILNNSNFIIYLTKKAKIDTRFSEIKQSQAHQYIYETTLIGLFHIQEESNRPRKENFKYQLANLSIKKRGDLNSWIR